ncbi:hypothetical protein [Gaoshiqia sp. Z1-71]|uniref:hypothetical protein n=1 Tax=Gaoshiqia hydrogeniformans TaxID=3290090 RepID=UPI003BF8AC3F
MKNIVSYLMLLALFFYLVKVGRKEAVNSSDETADPTNLIDNLARGFKSTFNALFSSESNVVTMAPEPESPVWTDDRPSNSEMMNYAQEVNSFTGVQLKKRRGAFYRPDILNSIN